MINQVDHADHPLRLLAESVLGRQVAINYLVQNGKRSYCDGERLYLPAHEDLDIRRTELIIQCALLEGDAFDTGRMQRLLGRKDLAERYLVLEVQRCCDALAHRLPSTLLNAIAAYRSSHQPADGNASLELALSNKSLPSPPSWYGAIKPWRVLRRRLQGGSQPLTSQKLAELEQKLMMIAEDDEEDDDNLQKASFWKWFTSPLGKESLFSKIMKDILDMRSSPGRDGSDDEGSGSSQMIAGRMAKSLKDLAMAIRSELDVSLPSAFAHNEAGAYCYHEWDSDKQRFRPDWVIVEETQPHALEANFAEGTLSGSNLPFQRALAGLYLGFQNHRGQPQGEDLTLDKMVRLAIDLQTGHSGDERIYSANLRTRRDLGVLVLLDASSSTLEHSANGQRVFDLQARAAWQLGRAFATLGDRVAMYGFNSWGRSLVRFQTLKTFDEAAGAGLEQRLRHLAIAGYTRCGGAIRHASHLIDTHAGTPYKLLVLISDGYPYDDQYEGEYAGEDTRKAIEEAGEKGIACVCLSVGSDAGEKRLQRIYGASNFLAMNTSEQLAPRLHRLVESAIASVAKKAA
ncbi:VWA domain-containing protein [Spongiibacter taiwanensis]|uniref:nitric oxide reductase activation protein NorD n=1 Tax=Spongiibacter taiwanensis TaxID=1748242 RepID=UPI002035BA40|nr:VWA domain-containing protein [Spongiibacter taiwanensis]USA42217.1 VWA domain-containing protein [Spongiibacter taiwanensis]